MSENHSVTRAHCNRCGGTTNHDVLASERNDYEDGTEDQTWDCFDAYEFLKCRGCDSIQMRRTSQHIGDEKPRVTYFPPAISRRRPEWLVRFPTFLSLPMNLIGLLNEVYSAVQNGLRCVAAMGIRTILETTMRNKVGDQHSFKKLIDEFQKAGYLSIREAQTLDSTLEAGHAAAHRAWEPTDEDIAILLDITETVIQTTYLHEKHARALEGRVPKRRHTT